MNCFSPYFISSRSFCQDQPARSGLYIDDLPGISMNKASSIVDGDLRSGRELFLQIEELAYKLTMQDVVQKIRSEVNAYTIIDRLEYFPNLEQGIYDNAGNTIEITLDRACSDRFTGINIAYIEFISDGVQNGLTIDVSYSGMTTTITTDVIQGVNRVPINLTSIRDSITILFTPTFNIYRGNNLIIKDHCLRCCENGSIIYSVKVNDSYTSRCVGVGVSATLQCDIETIACTFEYELKYAIWYRMGVLLCEHALSTERNNPLQRFFKQDSIENLLIKWWGGTDPKTGFEINGEYWRQLTSATKGIINVLKHSNSVCFPCANYSIKINKL